MRKALGATKEDECRLGVHKIANVSSTSLYPLSSLFLRELIVYYRLY